MLLFEIIVAELITKWPTKNNNSHDCPCTTKLTVSSCYSTHIIYLPPFLYIQPQTSLLK